MECRGSPPRGRGKVVGSEELPGVRGITPAWAGKSGICLLGYNAGGDHPRVGGEKFQLRSVRRSYLGSPPRGRGKAFQGQLLQAVEGITPAWAGKRSRPPARRPFSWDHPRVGGEKPLVHLHDGAGQGSPPRGRGKVPLKLIHRVYQRITPAWAGKRLKRSHRSGIFISGPIPFHSVLHRPAGSGGSRAGRDGAPAGQPQNAGPA